ncbi:MAG: SIMPL domain-containing protein [Coprococcus sp.]|nr:SIMPL domain-containing protein [Coprococcus sp.]
MERTIRVTGKGQISVKPDMIRLMLTLEDKRETYEETLEQSTVQVEMLKDCFEKLGFERTDLKTLNFNVDTEYESYQDRDKSWKRRFMGYKFVHNMKIEFDADNKRLGQVLYALAHSLVQPEFRINYTIKDTEAAKNQLLGKAVEDSREKARVLTEAAGVKLGDIITIDYSWGEITFLAEPMARSMSLAEECCMAGGSYDIDIEPDDIDVSDTVTVVWQIG